MTTTAAGQVKPRLRPEIVLGAGQWRGDKFVHQIKDPLTGCFYRIGPREYFLLSLMDGEHSLDDIGAEYAVAFNRRLGPDNWQQLFTMLYQRQLLDDPVDEAAVGRLAEAAAKNTTQQKRGPLLARFPLFDPGPLFNRIGPRLALLFSGWFVAPALLAVVALTGYVIWELPRLIEVWNGDRPLVAVVLAFVITWIIVVLHELAHGLTCHHFGGQVNEIGVLWRFPLLAPYCRVDDVVLFKPHQRVATAFAGVFVSMLALLPFAGLWAFTADGGVMHDFAGAMLLFGSVTAGINLVPFLRLDGYHMLSHALNLADLRADTYRFYGQLLRGGPRAVATYRRRERTAYASYGLATALFAVTIGVLLVRLWYSSLSLWVGSAWAITILVAEAVLLGLLVWYGIRRTAARAQAATAETANSGTR